MNRRKFLYRGTGLAAAGILLNFKPLRLFANADVPVICKVKSTDYYKATEKAIHELGGITRFVKPGSKVGFLINSAFDEPGAYVDPDIALAMLFLCWEAGAKEIVMLQPVAETYWQRSNKFAQHRFIINELKEVTSNVFPAVYNEEEFEIRATIPGAVALKDAEIVKAIRDVDVFINIPILKHHATSILTGALKNMMGLTTRKTNVTFHLGSGKRNDPEYLAQCIADLNLVRKPDLIVADATNFITGNGPDGPGPMKHLDLVVAGTDAVAIDAFGANCLDRAPEDIITVVKAYELGLGEMDLKKLSIVEYDL
jgi:uncharacterized protein (DUF362 family)